MTQTPLAVRMRPDLQVFPQPGGDHPAWVVKDPIALRYQRLGEEEFAILQWLDGRVSLDQVREKFAARFAPQQLSRQQLHQFLGRLHRQGLLLAESSGQHETLLQRWSVQRRWEWFQRAIGILAIRFRGADPTPVLEWLYPRVRWMLSRGFLALWVTLVLAAASLAVVQIDQVLARLPELSSFLRMQNLLWLAVTLGAVKVLHELGHALVCKHLGGECHEIGLMLLVFTPCLYCDVSDCWTWSNRWRRMAVAAAGMGAELVLAAVATLGWWFSQPGWLNQMCLNVMLLCSVNTLLFNGNPLLRYDGYYLLSDWWNAPNLGAQSRALVRQAVSSFFLGVPLDEPLDLPDRRRWLFAIYAVASTLYSWCVVGAILFVVYQFLEPKRLELLAGVAALLVAVGLLTSPAMYAARLLRDPMLRHRIRRGRLAWSSCLALAILAAVFAIPWPCRVTAPWVVDADGAHHVYVSVAGRLTATTAAGTPVAAGQTLARLEDPELARELARLSGQREEGGRKLTSLEARQAVSAEAAVQIPATRESLADLDRRWQERSRDAQRLTLTAPIAGVVLPPPSVSDPPDELTLPTWSGTPLDERNLGSWLPSGTLLCQVGDPARFRAVLTIDQTDVEFVRPGQRVWLQPHQLPGCWLAGSISEIAKLDAEESPERLDRPGGSAGERPGGDDSKAVRYQAIAQLDEFDPRLLLRTTGQARISVGPQALWRRAFRYLARTFSLPL
jgi:putative peptide zinc metalloprotease protein